jgi:HK97 family phage major capsid protein
MTTPVKKSSPPQTLPIQTRSFQVNRQAIDEKKRTAEFSFSSETPVERWWGIEILDHAKDSMRTDRILAGAPLLDMHDWDKQIGVIEDAWIEKKRGIALARFSKNPAADEVFKDVIDEIKSNVSVSYIIHELVLVKQSDDGPDEYRVSDWEPIELSIVSVPADISVGLDRVQADRSGQTDFAVRIRNSDNRQRPMRTKTADDPANGTADNQSAVSDQEITVVREQTRADETRRVRNILEIGRRFNATSEAETAVAEGRSLQEFEHYILTEKLHAKPIQVPDGNSNFLGLSPKERGAYSIVKAIRELSTPGAQLTGLEAECSRAIERELSSLAPDLQRSRRGNSAYVPMDIRTPAPGSSFALRQRPSLRDMNVSMTPNQGLDFVAEEFIPSLIDLLRNRLVIRAAGATILSGLQGMVVIPKQVGPTTAYWMTETGVVPDSTPTTSQVPLRPRRLSAQTLYSQQLVAQSSLDIEAFVRRDLALTMAQKLDSTALFGDPTLDANSPRGLFGFLTLPPDPLDLLDVIQQVAFQPVGANALYQDYIAFVTSLESGNIPFLSPAWLVNPATWGRGIGTPKFPNTGFPIVESTPAGDTLLGYPYLRTNQIPSAPLDIYSGRVIFGDFAQMLVGSWVGFQMVVDPFSKAGSAQVVVTVHQFADLNLRYRRAFCVSTNSGSTFAEAPLSTPEKTAPEKNAKK